MGSKFQGMRNAGTGALIGLLLMAPHIGQAQENSTNGARDVTQAATASDLATVQTTLQQLQEELRELRGQVQELKSRQEAAKAESRELRQELEKTKTQFTASAGATNVGPDHGVSEAITASASAEERIAKLEENQQFEAARIAEQSQTKVESASKYRARLTGMVLFNTYGEHGSVINADFPQLAIPAGFLDSGRSFGGSLRQSQIGIEAFGPTIAGARTSADIQFDFAGGFPEVQNGAAFGIMRLRTGTIRFDWAKTSVIVGQDTLFFAPLSPTSIATLAAPALSYSGNLWSWTPQIRVEHRFTLSDSSTFSVQGGILDNLSGDSPPSLNDRYPSWGEYSGQPAYAARISWTKNMKGQNLTLGAGGYYGRQFWGFGRNIDGWAGTMDMKVPLGSLFEFSGQFYRGKALGGIGGGLGQSVLWNGSLGDPNTRLYGLNSLGGWAQFKYRATLKLQFNGAFGQENPYAADLRNFGGNGSYYGPSYSKNQSALANAVYQPRSDFVFSIEYRRLKTFILDSNPNSANVINLSLGYLF